MAALMEDGEPSGGGEAFNTGILRSYLASLLLPVMGASRRDLESSLFDDTSFEEKCTRFASDAGCMVVYVTKELPVSAVDGDGDLDDTATDRLIYTLHVPPIPSHSPSILATLALIKRMPTLDANVPLASQLHFVLLSASAPTDTGSGRAQPAAALSQATQATPYEGLHSLVHWGVAPWFDSYVSSKKASVADGAPTNKKAGEAQMGIPVTKRKFAELELSLLHLQQNVEIPETHLSIHPAVRKAVEQSRAASSRPSIDAINPPSLLEDTPFLNRLQSDVNSWIKEVQAVTKMSRDVASGTASQEINFWLSMERALEGIDAQLRGDEVVLALDILKHAKRFHATVSFLTDTGLVEAIDIVHKYNILMKDFPLNELLSATDLDKVQDSLYLIFGHINKKLKLSPYPIRRALSLVEAISVDFSDQLLKVLGSQRPMYMEYETFERSMNAAADVFLTWDENMKEFTNVAREVSRKRSEKFIPIKITPAHSKLQERIAFLRAFRRTHEQLRVMTGPTRGLKNSGVGALTDIDMEEEVRLSYENVKNVDVLDVSVEGTQIWVTAEAAYNDRVARIENQIISRLRDKLGKARNAQEMFRVFSKFNTLFVRPKIRGAIQEYQTRLIESVKEDIKRLHLKFTTNYRVSEAHHMSQMRDLPPVAGAIVWARQIDRQLTTYMRRVEDVLGKGWESYAEGQKLQAESQSFKRKLDTKPVYDAWLNDINRRGNSAITGRLFDIVRARAAGSTTASQLQLAVNFDPQVITLFKEVRHLMWLNFQVPLTISHRAKDAKRVYPHAVSLMESVRTYTQVSELLSSNPKIVMLLADYRAQAQQMISKGMALQWDFFVNAYDSHRFLPATGLDGRENKHFAFVRDFASMVSALQDKSNYLIDTYSSVTAVLEQLESCSYTADDFAIHLGEIQKTVDRLSLESYANLEEWVKELDREVEGILFKRLVSVLTSWMAAFDAAGGDDSKTHIKDASNATMSVKPLVHEIRIRNQVIYLDPPIEFARKQWLQQLQQLLWVVCGLNRIRSSRYELRLQMANADGFADTYRSLLTSFTDDTLERPLKMIEAKVREVSEYVGKWLQFQSLWDLEAEYVYNRLGDSLGDWGRLLSEIRQTRSTFDNSDTQKAFGACIIDYANAQSKVNAKYDTWQRDLLSRYGNKLGTSMKDVHSAIQKARGELETQTIEGSTTAQAVTFITFVQDLKRRVVKWAPDIEVFAAGEKTLERQRYPFASDWLYIDQVQGEWSAFNEILKRKDDMIRDQIAGLQLKIVAEDRVVDGRITELVSEWETSKPLQGSLKSEDALNTLNVFEGRLDRLQEDFSLVCRAKEALDLEQNKDDRLTPVAEELRDLKAVWAALSGVWLRLGHLKEISWVSVQPRKVRHELDSILASTRDLPSRMRQYAAFEFVQEVVKTHLKANTIISELKSEALRDRHWSKLLKILRVSAHYSATSLTLGNVYDLDLKKNEKVIKDVIIQAQGEMALEEFLKQVKETWTTYSLDLTNYQNKCRLIRGWDDLFTKCSENINSLAAMKMSPYYKVFEEEAVSWEDKLNRVHVLFDVWIDVQRQWVYLEGIFSGSADIKHLLPVESARFQNINAEFLTVLKKVYKSPFVLDVLSIPGVQKSMERLADLLSKIQKALGEYLERERSSFPRFYFVGDEDLLEIIGNSKDIRRVMKHFKKMFAGISSICLDDSEEGVAPTLLGFASREGEEVPFKSPIQLKDFPRINDWLSRIESEMRLTLASMLSSAVKELQTFFGAEELQSESFFRWIECYPAQLVVLAIQITWTNLVESALDRSGKLSAVSSLIHRTLDFLAVSVLEEMVPIQRRKCEHLITELVHQRDIVRTLDQGGAVSKDDFSWLYHLRFYLDDTVEDPLQRLQVRMANAVFPYGYEYLGVPDRLVQTPLTDKCYLTLTQALDAQLGGSPFGPAGTGKTESVKALGVQLGRFVLVFCCDETFDFQAMGRIFVGLCQVGAWGCFDEFNRLEERILSAVSQQIQSIQQGLARAVTDPDAEVEIVGNRLKINPRTGIFITMNPGYAGRSNLPDNLKKLFRSMAMTRPDLELIAQVMLFSQGFHTAEILASKIVPFFNLCLEQLSPQPHYDFGLRALKSVLVSAGLLKRSRLLGEASSAVSTSSDFVAEQEILIQSVTETIVPKLVADDVPLLKSLLADVFPDIRYVPVNLRQLSEKISNVCEERKLVQSELWVQKVIQLYQIQNISHGLMMVGPSGTGKSQAWQVLLAALERLDGIEGLSYVINPKSMDKDALYGTLDPTTREWNDGLFTHILRKIIDNVRGEASKRHWIVFDGDVDPEWVENLNSVLDDNRLLTLPNGERLNLPSNVRIMFEVEHLRAATLATVSRCGMVWFSDDIVDTSMMYHHFLGTLEDVVVDADDDDTSATGNVSPRLTTQRQVARIYRKHFEEQGIVEAALAHAEAADHIMDFTVIRATMTLFSLLNQTVRNIAAYNLQHPDFPLSAEKVDAYVNKRLLINLVWAFAGDSSLQAREELGNYLRGCSGVDLPPAASGTSLIDYDVEVASAEWVSWQSRVPVIDIETHSVTSADVVIPTIDTIRHEEVLYSWLAEHKPLILCGPPGSGKTMTLFSALRKLPDLEVAGLNFSSATTPELILKTFEQYCEYRKTPSGVVLSPPQIGRWLVVFCDEINLPACDKYGTQRVVSFLRQLVESNGFWRTSDLSWVRLERIQFVGACNPPTDPGRVPLSHRFLRHAPVVMVDYPGEISLNQIYGTFNRALLKVTPNLRGHAEPLTQAMVGFYLASQKHFTVDKQAHYVYSPRELTRWVRGIYEALKPLETLSVEGLVRVWAHEGLRLFSDRLVTAEEKLWTDEQLDQVAMAHFPTINKAEALARPLLFSNWTSRHYVPVDREQLREYTKARLRVFHEEELDVQLVLFDDVLDHVLRIDRVFRQVQGHLLLIGVSGGGKTTLSRFVAWMNGLGIYQIKVSNKYTGEDFDEDLRTVLRRSGCKGEKMCFIMDESNVLDSGFLERMNTLLANAEIPGLFEGDEYSSLMTACKEGSQRDGLMLDSHEELYRWFTQQVARNLHVVFTMNPPEHGLASRAATSPALFNRCVLDWFGDWTEQALFQVALEFTQTQDLDGQRYAAPPDFPIAYEGLPTPPTHRLALVNAMVHVHKSMYDINARLARRQGRHNHVTPRHYLDFINHFVRLFTEKRDELEEQQRHLNIGLDKLSNTVVQVEELRKSLAIKRTQLEKKDAEANSKLRQMVTDQQEAEAKKAASISIQAALVEQDQFIQQRREVVMSDLAEAEPAVLEALAAVGNIRKQHLSEVRSMANPPEAVKMAMESACSVLGHQVDSWKTVQSIIRKDDFIASIQNFDTNKMTKTVRDRMLREYIARPNFNYEVVNRASRACGPLVQWVIAQVRFSEILDKVEPLRQEVLSLEEQAEMTKEQAQVVLETVAQLEASIERYKREYAVLISETQAIKGEMERVQGKVHRSVTLLDSLSSEQTRWDAGSRSFEAGMDTLSGDVLLSAAFLAYGGFFDQQYREAMWQQWTSHLQSANLAYRSELSFAEFLSTADDRIGWQSRALPADELCTENAIMLKRYNRYPLIIDPTGQAATFLQNEYRERKITVTSFLDEAFLKNLESALRFGNPLLIQDVEHLDPILNAVLNKEIRRTGGRVLIRLGSQDIDFSPAFTMFMSTRDSSVDFPADICSRVTFVNFTMTRSSLQTQALDKVLKAERPETDQKRSDLMRLQGEFRLRLRHLEKSLLQALNDSAGNILDDDKVISTLETLKKEAAEVTRKVEDTDAIMAEVDQVTSEYAPLAQACSSIYFLLDQLASINHFYQFSLQFFLDIFDFVLLKNPRLRDITDNAQRLQVLTSDIFLVTFTRASRGLLHQDHVVFAVLLARLRLRATDSVAIEDIDSLLEVSENLSSAIASQGALGDASNHYKDKLSTFAHLEAFKGLIPAIENQPSEWAECLQSVQPERKLPDVWQNETIATKSARAAMVMSCIRPERTGPALSAFSDAVFGTDLSSTSEYDLKAMVESEIAPNTPIMLCSVAGYDASYRVDHLVQEVGVICASVAMGSPEGYTLADQAIAAATRSGTWVLLKNVHLSPAWLAQLEKRLHTLSPHPSFRLFLTTETNLSVPVNILRRATVVMNEPPPGIKANLMESLRGLATTQLANGPAERIRLFFLLAWFHAVVQERLRFTPMGWSKSYEFNDSDFDAALNVIDSSLRSLAKGRANVNPAQIPWIAIRTLIKQAVYGGRIDSDFDQRLLDVFVDQLFSARAYEDSFYLVPKSGSTDGLLGPEGTQLSHFVDWVSSLPEREPPSWLGLPVAAERIMAVAESNLILSKLRKMRNIDEDAETVTSEASGAQPAWMKNLVNSCQGWLKSLPDSLTRIERAEDDPLSRFFAREASIGGSLLAQVRRDLQALLRTADGSTKQTNDMRALMEVLTQGIIPAHWRRYKVAKDVGVAKWLLDFARRLQQLQRVANQSVSVSSVWLGGLFQPAAYITASRQAIAHQKGWSLEELVLRVDIEESDGAEVFVIEGLTLEGADWSNGHLSLNEGGSSSLRPSQISWSREKTDETTSILLPVYLNSDRTEVLFTVTLDTNGLNYAEVIQRGVCLKAVV